MVDATKPGKLRVFGESELRDCQDYFLEIQCDHFGHKPFCACRNCHLRCRETDNSMTCSTIRFFTFLKNVFCQFDAYNPT